MPLDFIRSSTLDLIQVCPQKFNLYENEKLGNETEGTATQFGHAWHQAQHLWRQGKHWKEAFEEATQDFADPLNGVKTKDKIRLGLQHYQARYGGPLKPVNPNASEQEFLIRLPGISIPIKGTMDIVAWWDSNEGRGTEKWVVDHKTTARLEGNWNQRYAVSNQFKCYYKVAREEFPDLAGVLVDVFHVTKGVTTPRGMAGKTQAEIDGVHLYRLPLRFNDFILKEWEKTVKAVLGALKVYEAEGHFPLNAPTACGAYGTTCPFLDICACQDPDMRETIKKAFRSDDAEELISE